MDNWNQQINLQLTWLIICLGQRLLSLLQYSGPRSIRTLDHFDKLKIPEWKLLFSTVARDYVWFPPKNSHQWSTMWSKLKHSKTFQRASFNRFTRRHFKPSPNLYISRTTTELNGSGVLLRGLEAGGPLHWPRWIINQRASLWRCESCPWPPSSASHVAARDPAASGGLTLNPPADAVGARVLRLLRHFSRCLSWSCRFLECSTLEDAEESVHVIGACYGFLLRQWCQRFLPENKQWGV